MDGEIVGKKFVRLFKIGCWWIPRFALVSVKLSFISSGFRQNSVLHWGSDQATQGETIRDTIRWFHGNPENITLFGLVGTTLDGRIVSKTAFLKKEQNKATPRNPAKSTF